MAGSSRDADSAEDLALQMCELALELAETFRVRAAQLALMIDARMPVPREVLDETAAASVAAKQQIARGRAAVTECKAIAEARRLAAMTPAGTA